MKVIFAAQGSILNVFHAMDVKMRKKGIVTESAYWVADSEYYESHLAGLNLLGLPSTRVLKEWLYTDLSKAVMPENWSALERKYEAVDSLWNAIVADRRLMHGRLCKTKQQYQGHFSHDELKTILYSALHDIDALVLSMKPDRIITFVPATFGDILLYQAALANGIEYRVLRSTKVENYVGFSDRLGASSSWLESSYKDNLIDQENKTYYSKACVFLAKGVEAPIEYEGSIAGKKNTMLSLIRRYISGAVGSIVLNVRRVRLGVTSDNHIPPAIGAYIYGNLFREIREIRIRNIMKKRQFSIEDARDHNFVFFPMHCEPEVALSVYGREHQNQIETIRRIAQSIPVSWKIVVKEHPRSIYYRSYRYYQKLLDIPNLVFADPDTKPFFWNKMSRAVVTISGFAGFEAAMTGVPVIVLGDASFSLLPETMLRTVKDMASLSCELKSLLESYKKDEKQLLAYIMANMQTGVDVNLYSDLLSKSGRISMDTDTVESQVTRLSEWIEKDLNEGHVFSSNQLISEPQ